MSVLRVSHLSYQYPTSGNGAAPFALNDISFEVKAGELLCILGPNGSGKSTLLRLLCGIYRAQSGRVELDGAALDALSQKDIARRVALLAQEANPFFGMTVEDTVMLGRFPHKPWLGWSNRGDEKIVDEALRETDLAHYRHRSVNRLSSGEARRVQLARALAQQPKLLLLDEPTAHLDPRHQVEFIQRVEDLRRSQNLAVITVLHDIHLALEWCPRLLFLKNGAVFAQGEAARLAAPELLEKLYDTPVRAAGGTGGADGLTFFGNIRKKENHP